MLKRIAVLAVCVLVSSCNSSKSNGTKVSPGTLIDAQFIDDPVKGLEFVSLSGSKGKTGNSGKFSCKKGEEIKFNLAGLELGEAKCGEKIFVDDLISDDPDHSPEKVAAIIQSFAVKADGSDELDLSKVSIPQGFLKEILFSDNLKEKLEEKIADPKIKFPKDHLPTAKDPNEMRDVLDKALSKYVELPSHLNNAIDKHAGNELKISGKLIKSSSFEECPTYVESRLAIQVDKKGNKPASLAMTKLAYFSDFKTYDSDKNLCSNDELCTDHTSTTLSLPNPKPITSSKIQFVTNFESEDKTYKSLMKTELRIESEVEFKLSGVMEVKVNGAQSTNVSCNYEISDQDLVRPIEEEQPVEENQSSEDQEFSPSLFDGTYSGQTSCYLRVGSDEPSEELLYTKNISLTKLGTSVSVAFDGRTFNNLPLQDFKWYVAVLGTWLPQVQGLDRSYYVTGLVSSTSSDEFPFTLVENGGVPQGQSVECSGTLSKQAVVDEDEEENDDQPSEDQAFSPNLFDGTYSGQTSCYLRVGSDQPSEEVLYTKYISLTKLGTSVSVAFDGRTFNNLPLQEFKWYVAVLGTWLPQVQGLDRSYYVTGLVDTTSSNEFTFTLVENGGVPQGQSVECYGTLIKEVEEEEPEIDESQPSADQPFSQNFYDGTYSGVSQCRVRIGSDQALPEVVSTKNLTIIKVGTSLSLAFDGRTYQNLPIESFQWYVLTLGTWLPNIQNVPLSYYFTGLVDSTATNQFIVTLVENGGLPQGQSLHCTATLLKQ